MLSLVAMQLDGEPYTELHQQKQQPITLQHYYSLVRSMKCLDYTTQSGTLHVVCHNVYVLIENSFEQTCVEMYN